LPAIAAQIRERAERHAALAGEIEDLQRQKRLSVRKSEDDDFFDSVERNRMLALATSMDPKNRFEARARIATALRDMLAGIICYPDKTIRINFPEVEIRPLGEYLTPDDVVRKVVFATQYDEKMRARMLMHSDPPLPESNGEREVEITGFAPSLLLSALARPNREPPTRTSRRRPKRRPAAEQPCPRPPTIAGGLRHSGAAIRRGEDPGSA
jgi:hypothetical protein